MTLSIARIYPTNTSVVLSLRGSVDVATAPDLRAAIIIEASRLPRPEAIVVDLTGIDHIDVAGVGTLVVGNRLCAVLGVDLAVRGPSPLIRGLLGLPAGDPVPLPGANRPPRPRIGRGSAGGTARRRTGPVGVRRPPRWPSSPARPPQGP